MTISCKIKFEYESVNDNLIKSKCLSCNLVFIYVVKLLK